MLLSSNRMLSTGVRILTGDVGSHLPGCGMFVASMQYDILLNLIGCAP